MMACKFVPLPESSTPIFSFSISFPFSRSQGLREQAALVGVLDLAPASDDAADAEGLLAGIGQGGLHGLSLVRIHDENHAEAHVEGLERLLLREIRLIASEAHHGRNGPSAPNRPRRSHSREERGSDSR